MMPFGVKGTAAFKLDLPNGTYRVTNTFMAAIDATHTINLLANGTPVIKDLVVTDGGRSTPPYLYCGSYGRIPHPSHFHTERPGASRR